jgi:hypothetical protein
LQQSQKRVVKPAVPVVGGTQGPLLVLLVELLAEEDAVADAVEPLDELGLTPVDEVLVLPTEDVLDGVLLEAVELGPPELTPDCVLPLVVAVSSPLPPGVVPPLVPQAAASKNAPVDAQT